MQPELHSLIAFGAEGLFYILVLFFTFHVFFLGYHWFNYGTDRQTSLIALATYLGGGAVLFMTLAFSLMLI